MRTTHTGKTRPAVVALAAALLAGGLGYGVTQHLPTDPGPTNPASTDTVVNAAAGQSQRKSKASNPCWTGAVQIKNKKFVKTVYEWPDTPGAQASIPGPGKKIFEYKLEISSKVSATLGATYKQVSAGLGFEVNRTQTVTDRTEIELPKPVQYRVRAGMIYKQYQFDVYKERGFWNWHGDYLVCSSHLKEDWVNQGTSTALKPWMEAFRKTKAPKRTTH